MGEVVVFVMPILHVIDTLFSDSQESLVFTGQPTMVGALFWEILLGKPIHHGRANLLPCLNIKDEAEMVDLAGANFMGYNAVAKGYVALTIWTIHILRLIDGTYYSRSKNSA